MIPKTIHYCWFGGQPLPNEFKKYIDSWKKYCPDYEIIEWNESNYDVNKCDFIREAYKQKKWAFVSDYARLDIIYNYGGIYLDTDVEVVKRLDGLLKNDAFMGFEKSGYVATGLGFGAKKGNMIIKENLLYYQNIHFTDEKINEIACPIITTNILMNYGLVKNDNKTQKLDDILICSSDYFCPKDSKTGVISLTSNTYTIHHYSGTWLSEDDIKRNKFRENFLIKFKQMFGNEYEKKYGLILYKIVYFIKHPVKAFKHYIDIKK